jgi:uncharacterized membrane protein YccC
MPRLPNQSHSGSDLRPNDPLPCRSALTDAAAVELFWIASVWPNGALAITFTAIGVTLLAPRAEQAYTSAVNLMAGIVVSAVCAAIILFAVLPKMESFPGFCLALAL